MNYTASSMLESNAKDAKYKEFIQSVKAALRTNPVKNPQLLTDADKVNTIIHPFLVHDTIKELQAEFQLRKTGVDAAFKNNFHTGGALN